MLYHYTNQIGDKVRVSASPNSGDGMLHNGLVGVVAEHALEWDDDRAWPEVRVQMGDRIVSVLDYNLKPA